MGPLSPEVCSLPLSALRSFRGPKAAISNPCCIYFNFTKLWLCATNFRFLLSSTAGRKKAENGEIAAADFAEAEENAFR